MSKRKFKLSVPGILFLAGIGILLIAMIAIIIALTSSCKKDNGTREASVPSPLASEAPTAAVVAPEEVDVNVPVSSDAPAPQELYTPEPVQPTDAPSEPEASDPEETSSSVVIAPTPVTKATATPKAKATESVKIYTKPTTAQKKDAKAGYVMKDKVNMRKGPGTNYELVKKSISKNTSLTLYAVQNGWWFCKCGSQYGYIRADMVKIGSSPTPKATATPKPTKTPKPTATPKSTETPPPGTFIGTVRTNSVVAFRASPSTAASKVIKELKNGEKVIVYYKCLGNGNKEWYYCEYQGKKGYIWAKFLKVPEGVPFNE